MGLPNSVEGARHYAERTLHSLTVLPGSYAARLRLGYNELGSRLAFAGLGLLAAFASPASAIAAPFNGVPESLGSRNAVTLTTKEPAGFSFLNKDFRTDLTAKINNGQEIPPPAPGEVNPPFVLRPNRTILISPLLESADGTQLQPKVNKQETPVPEDAGVEPEKGDNQEVPPPPEGVSANPPSVLDLGPNQSQVLSLTTGTEGNPIPSTPAGGESTDNDPWEITRGFKLYDETPGKTLIINNFPGDVPQGQIGYRIRPEAAADFDKFINGLSIPDPSGARDESGEIKRIKIDGVVVEFRPNPQLRSGIGTYDLQSCKTCTKTPDRMGILGGVVEPANSRKLFMESNFFKPERLDPAYREELSDLISGGIGIELSRILYGVEFNSGKLTQEQRNYIGQLAVKLQYEIRPIEMVASTTR